MEQDCRYVVNNEGNAVLHPKTGEPLQDCKTTKSDLVVAMETVERLAKLALPNPDEVDNSNTISTSSTSKTLIEPKISK
jgi:hypothetical protein